MECTAQVKTNRFDAITASLLELGTVLVNLRKVPSRSIDKYCESISKKETDPRKYDPCRDDFYIQPAPDFDKDSEASPRTSHHYKRYYNGRLEVNDKNYSLMMVCKLMRDRYRPRWTLYRYWRTDIGCLGECVAVSRYDGITNLESFFEGLYPQTNLLEIGRNEHFDPKVMDRDPRTTIVSRKTPSVMKIIPAAPISHVMELKKRFSDLLEHCTK